MRDGEQKVHLVHGRGQKKLMRGWRSSVVETVYDSKAVVLGGIRLLLPTMVEHHRRPTWGKAVAEVLTAVYFEALSIDMLTESRGT